MRDTIHSSARSRTSSIRVRSITARTTAHTIADAATAASTVTDSRPAARGGDRRGERQEVRQRRGEGRPGPAEPGPILTPPCGLDHAAAGCGRTAWNVSRVVSGVMTSTGHGASRTSRWLTLEVSAPTSAL